MPGRPDAITSSPPLRPCDQSDLARAPTTGAQLAAVKRAIRRLEYMHMLLAGLTGMAEADLAALRTVSDALAGALLHVQSRGRCGPRTERG
jgi:hypothetical protein